MDVSVTEIFILVAVTIVTVGWRILNWVWVRPKYLERRLREQGFAGNSYRLFSGDLKESSMMSKQANSKPINISDDISPRVIPIVHHTVEKYGMSTPYT
uniref:Birch protein n=1 Tax=Betula platyphylla TaxID=78630 RepID=A0A9E9L5Q4_BETPL|nr:birch protein [Betula platyphylla]